MSEGGSPSDGLRDLTNEEIRSRIKMYENNMKQYKLESNKINHDLKKV